MIFARVLLRTAVRGLVLVFLSLVLAVVLFHFVFQPFQVSGLSMAPTLEDRDYLLVDRVFFKGDGLERGDLVVFKQREDGPFLVKRVVGVAGDVVNIRGGRVLVNGAPTPGPWSSCASCPDFGPSAVPEGCVFCLGDNTPRSQDSRSFGPVQYRNVYGRVLVRYLPLERMGPVQGARVAR
jgi:signal peptidase I